MVRLFYTKKEYETLKNNYKVLNNRKMELAEENKALQLRNLELIDEISKLKEKKTRKKEQVVKEIKEKEEKEKKATKQKKSEG